jgi:hypothetical protein
VRSPKSLSFADILFLPVGCLMQIPPAIAGIIALALLGAGIYFYYTTNSDFGGLARPAFQDLQVSPDFGRVKDTADNRTWTITYEYFNDTTFKGTVRFVGHWREDAIPFATHDVLVTSGDFADPRRVSTSVSNHHFYYQWQSGAAPRGGINLLHIVPLNEDIYRQLLKVHEWDQVVISGREILKIDMFAADGSPLGWWQDDGCNSTLVKSVQILPKP